MMDKNKIAREVAGSVAVRRHLINSFTHSDKFDIAMAALDKAIPDGYVVVPVKIIEQLEKDMRDCYVDETDEVGTFACCGALTYNPHRAGCPLYAMLQAAKSQTLETSAATVADEKHLKQGDV